MGPARKDQIRVKDRLLDIHLASGARWPAKPGQGTLQPVSFSINIFHDIAPASATDDLNLSIDYSSISKKLGFVFSSSGQTGAPTSYQSLEDVVVRALEVVQEALADTAVTEVQVRVTQLKAPLHCKDVGIEAWSVRNNGKWRTSTIRHFVTDFVCPTIIGVNDAEREEQQDVVVNISIETHDVSLESVNLDFRSLARSLWTEIGKTDYLTLEALTVYAAHQALSSISDNFPPEAKPSATVAIAKPCALVYASASEVQVTRTYDDFQLPLPSDSHKAVIALGSNLEDRFYNIEYALQLLEDPSRFISDAAPGSSPAVFVIDTSFLYETAPMYVTDQPSFINGACLIETNLEPSELLRLLKAIESTVGRVPTIRNGPRVVDLDVIFYDDIILDTRPQSQRSTLENLKGELVIPHPRLQEREFVLRPLNDMIPGYTHPVLRKSVGKMLLDLPLNENDPPMCKVLPFPDVSHAPPTGTPEPPSTLIYWVHPSSRTRNSNLLTTKPDNKARTRLMATLNVTPDSFSDGSDHTTLSDALAYTKQSISSGANIIDIGGYSTRPGAAFVGTDEEIQRVCPVVQNIRLESKGGRIGNIPISVDTFRPEVAEAAIKAGASCINDVHAFTGPKYFSVPWKEDKDALSNLDKMKEITRKYATPVVLMHSRGEAGQNKDYSKYSYAEARGTSAVVEGVRIELGEKVERIVKGKGGIRRWLVVADPGIGFSKTVEGNLELLRHGAKVTEDVEIGQGQSKRRNPLAGLPTLVGASRKSFLGTTLSRDERGRETEPKERVWATAATTACAVQQGAMIVRVHDVGEMADVAIVADALWN